jgi:hypothetical protein
MQHSEPPFGSTTTDWAGLDGPLDRRTLRRPRPRCLPHRRERPNCTRRPLPVPHQQPRPRSCLLPLLRREGAAAERRLPRRRSVPPIATTLKEVALTRKSLNACCARTRRQTKTSSLLSPPPASRLGLSAVPPHTKGTSWLYLRVYHPASLVELVRLRCPPGPGSVCGFH